MKMTNEQIEAIAEQTGRHAAERTRLAAKLNAELEDMNERHGEEMRSLAATLGLPDPTTVPPPPVNMGPVEVPPDAPPGEPVVVRQPYEAPRMVPVTPIPRPLRLRK